MVVVLALILNAALLVGSFLAGLAIRRGKKRQIVVICAIGLALCLAKAFLGRRPDLETRLFPWTDYVLFSGWNGALAMGVIGAMVGLVRMRRDWIFLVLAGVVTMMYFGDHLVWVGSAGSESAFGDLTWEGDPTRHGEDETRHGPPRLMQPLVPQTRSYTCGPAAAATLLRSMGIHTDEREMAILCLTRPPESFFHSSGTRDLGLYRGINKKLELVGADLRIRIDKLTFDELCRTPMPCLLRVRTLAGAHVVVVLDAHLDKLVVFNPASGDLRLWDEHTLTKMVDWSGVAFVLERPSGRPLRPANTRERPQLEPIWIDHDRRDQIGL